MIVASIILIALGLVVALLGFKLFRILLPIVAFIAGLSIGFVGFQGIFGKGFVSTTIALMVAVIVGVVLAILSFIFFEIAMVLIAAIVGATALSFLGVAIGLHQDGFIVFMLGLSGAIIAGIWAARNPISAMFVLVVTSVVGVAMVMAGIMLVVGNVSLSQLNDTGIIATVTSVVSDSFLWFVVWVGGSLVALQIQSRLMIEEFVTDAYQFQERMRRA